MPEQPSQQEIQFEAIGFDERRYQIACAIGEHVGSLILTTDNDTYEKPGLSPDQAAIMDFISQHIGTPFEQADVSPYMSGPGTHRQARFNRAVFEEGTGLYRFFTQITGKNNLWKRGHGSFLQFGQAPYTPSLKTPAESSSGELTPAENHVLNLLMNGAVTMERTPEQELTERLADLLQVSPDAARTHLHATIDKLRHLLQHPTFELLELGSGKTATTVVWTNPAIIAPPKPSSHEDPPQTAQTIPGKHPRTPRHPDISVIRYSADYARRVDVAWSFTSDEGLIINGQHLPLQRNTVRLLLAMHPGTARASAGRTDWLSTREIHRLYTENTEVTKESYQGFVAWANWTFDTLNQIAPVILINNNRTRVSIRDSGTMYSFNHAGDWATWLQLTPSLFPAKMPDDFTIFSHPVAFKEPPPSRRRRRIE